MEKLARNANTDVSPPVFHHVVRCCCQTHIGEEKNKAHLLGELLTIIS